jgi:O-antigen ligase
MGVQGRFGNQIRSIGMLLEMPNGMGPLRFRFHFPEDPHNTYINAFASYGWLGGFSYVALVVVTMIAGWTMVWRRSTVQPYAIAIWSVLFITLLQGLQIDIDHWRNVYLQLGLVWGLRAITPEPARGAQV